MRTWSLLYVIGLFKYDSRGLNKLTILIGMEISIIKIRRSGHRLIFIMGRSGDRLIFIMGNHILLRHLFLDGPRDDRCITTWYREVSKPLYWGLDFSIVLKFNRHPGCSAAEVPVIFHSDAIIITSNIVASRFYECWATNVSRQYRLRTQITLRALLVEPLKFLRHYLFRTHYG